MQFESGHISGHGRGKRIGFPTINLVIPRQFDLDEGIYAVQVDIQKHLFKGAMHFGPIPTFEEEALSLEVFLLDTNNELVESLDLSCVKIDVVKRLRDIVSFDSKEQLFKQIESDVQQVKRIISLE